MDYEIKYPITQRPGEFILLHYTKGYREVALEYQGEWITDRFTSQDLKRGITVNHPELGMISAKFAKEKLVANLIIDGYHSPINKDHPRTKLVNQSTFFWTLMGFTCISFLIELVGAIKFPHPLVLLLGPVFAGAAVAAYTITAVQLRKLHSSYFWLGFGMFSVRVLFLVYAKISGFYISDNLMFTIGLLPKLSFLLAFLFAIPVMIDFRKYERYLHKKSFDDNSILDN